MLELLETIGNSAEVVSLGVSNSQLAISLIEPLTLYMTSKIGITLFAMLATILISAPNKAHHPLNGL